MDAEEEGFGQPIELLVSRHSGANEGHLERCNDGDRTLFAREDYVEKAWRVVDPALKAGTTLYVYEPGASGPEEAEQVAAPNGWFDPIVPRDDRGQS